MTSNKHAKAEIFHPKLSFLEEATKMAGFEISSIDWPAFEKFLQAPTDAQLKRLAKYLDEAYEDYVDSADSPEEGDIALSWSSEGDDPKAAIAAHLKRDDWYDGLSDEAKTVWESAIGLFFIKSKEFKFKDESSIYWDVITFAEELAGKQKKSQPAVARFGHCPFRLKDPVKGEDAWNWAPNHSLHTPDEVKTMVSELEAVEAQIESSGDEQIIGDFQNGLMPALSRIVKSARMLLVTADT